MAHARVKMGYGLTPSNFSLEHEFLLYLIEKAHLDVLTMWVAENYPGELFVMVLEPKQQYNWKWIYPTRKALLQAFKDVIAEKRGVEGGTEQQFIHYWIAVILQLFEMNTALPDKSYTMEDLELMMNQ